ncbi:hypothetical protein B0X78_00215 [bacterium AM6]|nr:hypothetical protein B0X78_00215 [bacterium AM6]
MNYYSEWDPYAAQWIRNLIDAGLIPPGHVDTRSIIDVQPSDLAGYRQCHFFAGIAGWSLAARLAGWPDSREIWTGSTPCQPYSVAGKGKAQDDDRDLWPHFFRLIRARRPLSSWENRLRRRLARTGSTECVLTWKASDTPAGRSLSRLVPSTRPTAVIDSGLWPTPMAHEARLGYQRRRGDTKGSQESLTTVVVNVSAPLDDPRIAGLWPTPTASLADKGVRSTEVRSGRRS